MLVLNTNVAVSVASLPVMRSVEIELFPEISTTFITGVVLSTVIKTLVALVSVVALFAKSTKLLNKYHHRREHY